MKRIVFIVLGSLALIAAVVPERAVQFEKQARGIAEGRSPKLLARRQHGVLMIYTGKGEKGGQDLFFQSSNDVGDSFENNQRVNSVPGEVSDHGENSPQLLSSPDESSLYAIWNARDPKDPSGSHVRFSRSGAMRPAWSPAITVNDDPQAVSHGFQSAAVGPDGTIYVAWLDGRNRAAASEHSGHGDHAQFTGGTSDIYLSRSTDGGKTFQKNVKLGSNICPCCRVSIGFARNRVMVAWRQVEAGDLRDIYVASSSDKGQNWGKPVLVSRDSWKIKGCPHCGPSLASINDRLYISWFTEGSGKPVINLSYSDNGGETFAAKQALSTGTADPTRPFIVSGENKLAVIFQARDAGQEASWGKMGVYYREINGNGTLSKLIRAGEGKTGVSYPTAAIGMSGRVFLAWTESNEGKPGSYLLRGRTNSTKSE